MKLPFEHSVPPPPRSPRSYRVPEVKIMMVKDGIRMAPKFTNSLQAYNALKEIVAHADREHFIVICLDTKNKPLAINIVSTGTLDSSLVHPREVFKPAILCASRIIVAHNHPSGETEPSIQDRKVTAQLVEAGKILGIPVIDHIIIGDGGYYSFKDSGLIDSNI